MSTNTPKGIRWTVKKGLENIGGFFLLITVLCGLAFFGLDKAEALRPMLLCGGLCALFVWLSSCVKPKRIDWAAAGTRESWEL